MTSDPRTISCSYATSCSRTATNSVATSLGSFLAGDISSSLATTGPVVQRLLGYKVALGDNSSASSLDEKIDSSPAPGFEVSSETTLISSS